MITILRGKEVETNKDVEVYSCQEMRKNIIRTTNFFMDLFVQQKVPDVYSRIRYWNNDYTLYDRKKHLHSLPQIHTSYSVALIPDYLIIELVDAPLLLAKTFDQNNLGYAIFLDNGFELTSFLKNQFSGNYGNVKRSLVRLESCFNVRYKIFHGDIKKEEYHFIMKSLHTMLIRRFKQRKDKNEILDEWDEILCLVYDRILAKSASIFVIYDDETPIDISINYHFHKIMFSAVSSYDIDYYKFSLGNVSKIKLLEWCIANDYRILEFGYGDLQNKRRWSNHIYHFKYQVIFNHESLFSVLFAKLELLRLGIKEFLKAKRMDVPFKKFKAIKVFARRSESFSKTHIDYEKITVTDPKSYGKLKNIAYGLESPFHLKLIVNDFLYANKEHKDHIVVQEVMEEPRSFLISGKNNIQKFNFRN